MSKTDAVISFLEGLSLRLLGNSREEAIKTSTCVTCGRPAIYFKDAISKEEFSVTGMCQSCQDNFYEHGEEE